MKRGKEFKVNLDGKFYAVMGLNALVKMLNAYGDRVTYIYKKR